MPTLWRSRCCKKPAKNYYAYTEKGVTTRKFRCSQCGEDCDATDAGYRPHAAHRS